ncbi:hypothetical protein BS47DRAFT_1266499, partial [Hydnum rufescens UP504]
EFLDALLQYDGCGNSLLVNGCPSCQLPGLSGMYRCIECFNHQILCKDCCVLQHEHLPLHHINVWNGDFFECTTLATMGLKIYLGHTDCLMRKSPASFTIIHTNGIHHVDVVFCGCATIHQPQMCATFVIFNHFHLQMLQSKLLANHFIAAIERETDNTGLVSIKDRYISFLQMTCEWCHLMLLKRAGHGHNVSGVKGTQLGELAVLCPACPHPRINLPSNWESRPSVDQFLYHLHLATDANFRLKN